MSQNNRLRVPRSVSAVAALAVTAAGLVAAGAGATQAHASSLSAADLAADNVGKTAGYCAVKPSSNSLGGKAFTTSCDGHLGAGQGEYWCADFARWAWQNSDLPVGGLTAGAASFDTYGSNNGTFTSKPHPGDAITFKFSLNDISHHVGIIIAVHSDGSIDVANGDWGGVENGSESYFARTSHVVKTTIPAGDVKHNSYVSGMGVYVNHIVRPVGADDSSPIANSDFNGDAQSDVFNSSAGIWRYKSAGSSDWIKLRDSDATVQDGDLRLGDFDGDGKADVLKTQSSGWYVSHDGTGDWKKISDSSIPAGQLLVGDFNGDGKSDVFNSSAGVWRYKSAGSSDWIKLADSDATVQGDDLRVGDFNGDGKADVLKTQSSGWYVSSGGTGGWKKLSDSSVGASQLLVGDFNGDGKSDVFNSSAGVWRYKSAGSSDWIKLRDSDATVHGNGLRVGDFDGDGKADVMMTLSSGWYVSFAGTTKWYQHDSSTTPTNQTLISYGLPTYGN